MKRTSRIWRRAVLARNMKRRLAGNWRRQQCQPRHDVIECRRRERQAASINKENKRKIIRDFRDLRHGDPVHERANDQVEDIRHQLHGRAKVPVSPLNEVQNQAHRPGEDGWMTVPTKRGETSTGSRPGQEAQTGVIHRNTFEALKFEEEDEKLEENIENSSRGRRQSRCCMVL